MSEKNIQRCKDWVLGSSTECIYVPLSAIAGEGDLKRSTLQDALGQSVAAGLYAFVWIGDEQLKDNRTLILKGKRVKGKEKGTHHFHGVTWQLSDFPGECAKKKRFPLYIGKTGDFVSRISQHLMLRTEDWASIGENGEPQAAGTVPKMLYKPTTSCQFRSGLEHLFGAKGLSLLRPKFKNILLCFLPNEDVKDRFYLEDLAIGYFRPWFNVDSER